VRGVQNEMSTMVWWELQFRGEGSSARQHGADNLQAVGGYVADCAESHGRWGRIMQDPAK
jgi:hypothetical protein